MLGLMQDWPLLVWRIIDHAKALHPKREIVSRLPEGPIHRTNYGEVHGRALKVAQALDRLGIALGDRVATLAWNTFRHVETWYGIQGLGAICHTLNPRLFPEQLAWIINHAEDRIIFTDITFVPLLEGIAGELKTVERVVVLTDRAHMPEASGLPNLTCYEDLLAEVDGDFAWREFDERTAAGICYTSGTTGEPKGVVYAHRSNVIHALVSVQPDLLALRSRDSLMPVVPLFHANGWSTAYTGPLVGAKLVLPGGALDGASVYELLDQERVSVTAAVPTVWLMLLQHLEKTGARLPHLERVVIGGSAAPRAMIETFERDYGVEVLHAWGMTEMSPLGSFCSIKGGREHLQGQELYDLKVKQGHPPFTVEMRIVDDGGVDQPWDGEAFGHLWVRGPSIANGYFKGAGADAFKPGGWFQTGDVATMDAYGYMHITDRSKDVIKSGGEWISSIELENEAVGCAGVAEAAVIGLPHPKWDERPLMVIVKKEGAEVTAEAVLDHLRARVAKWQLPDDVVFVDEIPHTATGKIQKLKLREQFADHRFSTA